MFQKIINFIKFHNAFAIGLILVFLSSGAIMASEDVRNAVIGEKIVTEQGIDNSQLLSADMENFNINLKINNVLEDEENYYVDYAFNTLAVRENIWQPVVKSEKFTVNKTGLGNRDLGIYLAEELSEVVRGEMVYLKEAQKNERERGRTQIVKTTDYTGLIGLALDLKNKILPGYEPVVKPPVAEIVQELIVQKPVCQPIAEVCDGLDNDCDGLIDEGGVCEATPVTLSNIAITTPATKLVYTVGESLDITGLAITGTYSDGSTKIETITTANVTGFNSATSTTAQVLTIGVGGKTATYTVTVNVAAVSPNVDTTPPVIDSFTIPETSDSLTVSISSFTVSDDVGVAGYLLTETPDIPSTDDSNWSAAIPTNYIFSVEGDKTLYAWAKDVAGNISLSLNDLVTITLPPEPDTTAPVITLVGEAVVTVKVGDTYTDAGATATDDIDGDITGAIVIDNPVDTATAATYTVTYTVSDAAGNVATPVTRTVNAMEPES